MSNFETPEKEEMTIPNPFELWKKFYVATEDAMSTTVKESISTQTYAQMVDGILNQYLVAHKLFSEANTKNLENSPLPSKFDVARVAELVVSLEDKLDQIESGLITQLIRIVQHMNQFSEKLDRLQSGMDKQQGVAGSLADSSHGVIQEITGLTDRMDRLETAVNEQLQIVTGGFAQSSYSVTQTMSSIADRMDRLEASINTQLQGISNGSGKSSDKESAAKQVKELDQRVKNMEVTLKDINKSLKSLTKKTSSGNGKEANKE
ncbi:MAG: hypothetical protein ACM3QW_04335 [Ignavibacteriales bacterium]